MLASYSTLNQNLFNDSNIFTQEFRNKDGYSVLPYLKNKNTKLLYSLSRDGASSKVFHELCDNRGNLYNAILQRPIYLLC